MKQTNTAWLRSTLALALAISGCGTEGPSDGELTGSLQLSIELGGDTTINEVWYNITGNQMAPMTGFIDTSAPGATASVEVFGLMPGTGYSVELRAIVDDGTSCSGSAPFEVMAGVATPVAVMINCKPPERFGSVRVNGELNVCAELTKAVVSPLQTSVGSTINLSAQGFDADGDSISYQWSASGGPIDSPENQETGYLCASPGTHSVRIEVSDDDFTDCIEGWTVEVVCGEETGTSGPAEYTFTCLLAGLPIPLPVSIALYAEDPGFTEGTTTTLTSQLSYSVAPSVIGLLPDLAPDSRIASVDTTVGVAGGTPTSILYDATEAPNILPFPPVGEFDSTEVMTDITPDSGATEIVLSVEAFSAVVNGLPESLVPGGQIELTAGEGDCGPLEPVEGSGPLTFTVR